MTRRTIPGQVNQASRDVERAVIPPFAPPPSLFFPLLYHAGERGGGGRRVKTSREARRSARAPFRGPAIASESAQAQVVNGELLIDN